MSTAFYFMVVEVDYPSAQISFQYFEIEDWMLGCVWLLVLLLMRQDNAPQQCIQCQATCCFLDALRFFQSSDLVPLKATAKFLGHTKNRISLCTPPSPVGADEQNFERNKNVG